MNISRLPVLLLVLFLAAPISSAEAATSIPISPNTTYISADPYAEACNGNYPVRVLFINGIWNDSDSAWSGLTVEYRITPSWYMITRGLAVRHHTKGGWQCNMFSG